MVKKKILFAIMILFCISIIASENKSGIGKTEEAVINSIMDFIEKRNYSDARIKKFMSNNGKDSLEEEMLGFGLKKFSNNLRHENMLFQIDYISYKNNPCKLVIRLAEYEYKEGEKNLDEKSIKRFNKFFTKEATIYPPFIYIDEAGNMIQQERNEYRFVCEFPEGYRKYSTYKEKLVGPCVEMNLPEDLQKYYDFLYSAEEDTEYGYYEGIAGVKPMGRIALIELLELNDVNVFINLLKGDNPGGRIYAVEGLLRLENSQENVDLINKIFSPLVKDKITYTTIGGCLIETSEYEYYTYDENQLFPEINRGYTESSDDIELVIDLSFLTKETFRGEYEY